MRLTVRYFVLFTMILATCLFLMVSVLKELKSSGYVSKWAPEYCSYSQLISQVIKSPVENVKSPTDQQIYFATSNLTNPPQLSPCTSIGKELPIQRGILIYFPHHQSDNFFPEVKWLYRSWAEMLRGQPPNWRTDLVIYSYSFSGELRSLGCVNRIRQNKEEPSICRLFLYLPIAYRTNIMIENNFEHAFDQAKNLAKVYNDNIDQMVTVPDAKNSNTSDVKRSQILHATLRNYEYADSINIIYEGYSTFKMYDFVLRSDSDVFIYRHFSTYIPENCTFITGRGRYATDFNQRKLQRIARDMNLSYGNIFNMGSTWYGSPQDSALVADQTIYGMLWLEEHEFATPERESKLGVMMWPEWHHGVLLLYGQHLALNHLFATNQIRLFIGEHLLDQSSTDNTIAYVQQSIRLTLHCWHTDQRFSKFAFKMGQYTQSDLDQYRDDTTAQAYAMRMALESKYMTLEQLADLVRNATSK